MSLLSVQGLRLRIGGAEILRGISLELAAGEFHAIVGESGCGKSMTALSMMGLQPDAAKLDYADWQFDGSRIDPADDIAWRRLRQNDMAMIFQQPMTAMNPTMKVGPQIEEVLRQSGEFSRREAAAKAVRMLGDMGIRAPELRASQYPFELSGGMQQRAMIAMAMARRPKLLLADEPTTALDATVQAEVLTLLQDLRRETGMAVLLITHDLGVVARVADRVSVMYAGEVVEQGDVNGILGAPAHPYTRALMDAVPVLNEDADSLRNLPGQPPDLRLPINGCAFMARCDVAMQCCVAAPKLYQAEHGGSSRCWQSHPDYQTAETELR